MDLTYLSVRQKMVIMSGALIGLLLAALDQTIVGTALPKIVADLGGIDQYSWVITLYLLTSTATVPIVGKLSDIYGRKIFLVLGVIIFVGGSILAGLSQDILQLIVFRGIQGIGAGALMATTFTVVADLFPPSERGKWMGLVGAVFGLSSLVGPLVGGYLTDNLSWRWNFYVNVPVGALALGLIILTMPKAVGITKKAVDYLGAAFLIAGIVPLLLALTWGGSTYAWDSGQTITLFGWAAIALLAFLYIESRAEDPILPLDLFRNRVVAVSIIITFLSGVAMFASIVYIPLFAQVVQGKTATNSGIIVIPLVLSMVVGSIFSGQLISRIGRYKIFGIMGGLILMIGLYLLTRIGVDTSDATFMRYMIVTGLGLGIFMPTLNIAVQNAVPHRRLGTVTSSIQLFRSLGATMGLAVMGGLFNSQLPAKIEAATDGRLAAQFPPSLLDKLTDPQMLANPESAKAAITQVPQQLLGAVSELLNGVKVGLAGTIALEFAVAAGFATAAFLFTFFLREIPLRQENAVEQEVALPDQSAQAGLLGVPEGVGSSDRHPDREPHSQPFPRNEAPEVSRP